METVLTVHAYVKKDLQESTAPFRNAIKTVQKEDCVSQESAIVSQVSLAQLVKLLSAKKTAITTASA